MANRRITIRFDEDTIKRINQRCKKEARSKSNLIQVAVKNYLENLKKD